MRPTQILYDEHEIILLVLEAADRIAVKGPLPVMEMEMMIDFFRSFADHCHHAKEEQHLFPAIAKHGFSYQQGPLAVMMAEHEQGRALVRAMAETLPLLKDGDAAADRAARTALVSFSTLLRGHIQKENNVLFPMSERVLSESDQLALVTSFERVEQEEIGTEVHERYHQLARMLHKHFVV